MCPLDLDKKAKVGDQAPEPHREELPREEITAVVDDAARWGVTGIAFHRRRAVPSPRPALARSEGETEGDVLQHHYERHVDS